MSDKEVRVVALGARAARQAARHAYEQAYLARYGKPLPRADGDDWWGPDTEPSPVCADPAPVPMSRLVDLAQRERPPESQPGQTPRARRKWRLW